jgi:indolepyruvate ferredoxin oxidoreductase beta subunit
MSTRPIRISINALGGQGGGVLADWLVDLAETQGWLAQSTSVPGVAQRTGATVYYLELAEPDPQGREPVFALMPAPGDVDVVIASELMEAGRAIARGLVTPDRTTLIASTHRIYAISEKSALGDGRVGGAQVLEAATVSARKAALGDFQALAEANGSVISATLCGALAGSGALPFPRQAFEAAITRGGVGVTSSLRAFDAAYGLTTGRATPITAMAAGAVARPANERISNLPEPARDLARLGADRALDYQDRRYADLYLDRLEAVAEADAAFGGAALSWALTREAARYLALWMTYEDVIRVADLKTRASRFERFRKEVRADGDQIVHVTEFMHPRFEEFCDTLPRWLGGGLKRSRAMRRTLGPLLEKDRRVSTSRLGGFLLLWGLARLRRLRPGSLRYSVEQAEIEAWLDRAVEIARTDYDLAVEAIRLQRLVKGYGDTHRNGMRNYGRIVGALPMLQGNPGGAQALAALREAALKEEDGRALDVALTALQPAGSAMVAPADRALAFQTK